LVNGTQVTGCYPPAQGNCINQGNVWVNNGVQIGCYPAAQACVMQGDVWSKSVQQCFTQEQAAAHQAQNGC